VALLGYFISFHTYGSWLHGCDAGSVDRAHHTPGTPYLAPDPEREARERAEQKYPMLELDAERRFVVDATVREVSEYRGWALHAVHARTTHVHTVVTAGHTPERVMNDYKAYCTRRMREAGVLSRADEPWSYHGSTRYLDTEVSFAKAVHYVVYEQGPPLEMVRPKGWGHGG
jgi:hypothetical protein